MRKLLVLLSCLLTTTPAPAQTNPQKDIILIKAALSASNAAIASHSIAGIVQNITPGYSIVTGRGTYVTGRDSMAAFWRQPFAAMPGVVYVRTAVEVIISTNDSLAWETGVWTATNSYSAGENILHNGIKWRVAGKPRRNFLYR